MSLSIGDVAARSGLSRDTLRYYEKIGLVPHARRSPSGQREYEEPVLDQLLVVTALRNAGFSIAQVRG
ncbi:MAG: MerR family DNA-binding transcriptional regulator [Bifidobacterium sp.]|nr:MerR family DNA-binding transcriptional regulator [Bifidobacterium sp.]